MAEKMIAKKKTGAPVAATTAKKPLSKVLQKKASKAKSAALKRAGKTQVRLTRSTLRAAKAAENTAAKKSTKGARSKLQANKGQAPHSARISPIKGPIAPEASRTAFVEKYSTDRNWLLIDAANQTVGRLASEVAMLLRGKHKPTYTPNNDAGDFVVVINADLVKFSANKEEGKNYYKHSTYIGGLKTTNPRQLRDKDQADRIITKAVKGMVPRNPLGRAQMTKLKVYSGAKHPHSAQNPVVWQLRNPSNNTSNE